MQILYAQKTVSVTELKKNFSAVLAQAEGDSIAILNHNQAEAYLLPAALYEYMVDRLEDLEDMKLVQERENGPFLDVSVDGL